jgi:hsp70-interacting protein
VCAVGNSDEERRWFNEAMHSQVVDVIKRMKEIALVMSMPVPVLEAQGVTVEELEGEVINTIQHSLGVSLGC